MKIKNLLVLIALLAVSKITIAQQGIVMDYIPEKKTNVSVEDYTRGKNFLLNTYTSINDHNGELVYADYWNVASAYVFMSINKDKILDLLKTAKSMNSNSFCTIANHQIKVVYDGNIEQSKFYKLLGNDYVDLLAGCEGIELRRRSLAVMMKEKEDINLRGLNESLIDQLIKLMYKDGYYRREVGYNEGQKKLDAEVQIAIAKIFDEYDYPGKSLVGKKYMNYACMLLEHGGTMENFAKYFPIVAKALKEEEVEKPYVRMLIDRIHWRKTGKQIFGSHAGIPFDSDKIIADYKNKYDL